MEWFYRQQIQNVATMYNCLQFYLEKDFKLWAVNRNSFRQVFFSYTNAYNLLTFSDILQFIQFFSFNFVQPCEIACFLAISQPSLTIHVSHPEKAIRFLQDLIFLP